MTPDQVVQALTFNRDACLVIAERCSGISSKMRFCSSWQSHELALRVWDHYSAANEKSLQLFCERGIQSCDWRH